MVNLTCQLDWVRGCPDIPLNIILDLAVRVIQNEISTEWVDEVMHVALLNMGGHHPVHRGPE